jgi:hypothetical protein|tara:strand:- start:114 stop:341 length:228 start_codon:yes stop_codon:yes gene_type:complete
MWAIVLATMLASGEPQVPTIMSSYSTLNACRKELLRVGTIGGYEPVVSPMVGYAVVKIEATKTITAFCVKNMQSI